MCLPPTAVTNAPPQSADPDASPQSTVSASVWIVVAVAAFHVAYLVPELALLMGVYLYALVRLTEVGTARRAFYIGFGVGMACFVPQLWFFWGIFHGAAVALWAVTRLSRKWSLLASVTG